jgi:hypothetical protein
MNFWDWLEDVESWAWRQQLSRVQSAFVEQHPDGSEVYHWQAVAPTAEQVSRLVQRLEDIARKRRG